MGKRAKFSGLPVISLSAVNCLVKTPCTRDTVACSSNTQASRPDKAEFPTSNDVVTPLATKRPWLAARGDAAVCNFSRKARKPLDQGIWTKEQCDRAVEALQRDYRAASSKGPHSSLLRIWESMHRRVRNGATNYYPITPSKLAKVAAAFKNCGYRSFANYLSRAKEMHIQMGGIGV